MVFQNIFDCCASAMCDNRCRMHIMYISSIVGWLAMRDSLLTDSLCKEDREFASCLQHYSHVGFYPAKLAWKGFPCEDVVTP